MKYKKDPDDDESDSYILYRPVTVFDISQTEGEELPSFSPELLTQSVDGYGKFMIALSKTTDYKIVFKDLDQEINGECNHLDKTLYIRKGMSESQNIKTILHEIAHSKLHKVPEAHTNDSNALSRNEKEVEAESVAFVVSTYFGIDTSSYSFPYIVGWEEKDESLLRHSLKRIRDTAHILITQLEEELSKDDLTTNNAAIDNADDDDSFDDSNNSKAVQGMKLF